MKALRSRLSQIEGRNVTHQEMVRRIGCSNGAYRKWQSGTIPRGDWMLKILALCPDEETRANFFIDIAESGSRIPSTSRPELPKEEVKGVLYPGGLRSDAKFIGKHLKTRPRSR